MSLLLLLPFVMQSAMIEMPQSDLVDPGHSHSWAVIYHERKAREEVVLIDRTHPDPFTRDDKQYGTAVMRFIEDNAGDDPFMADAVFAVDCETQRFAMVDFIELTKNEENPLKPMGKLGEFQTLTEPTVPGDKEIQTGLFRQVCGQDWSFTPEP